MHVGTMDSLIADLRGQLRQEGYAVVDDLGSLSEAESLLRELGQLLPQYDGALRHEVRHHPGFDAKAYSQSTNTIRAHTEAPGWRPSPTYLALYCHRQATCGGGHTDLLDVRRLIPMLTADERQLFDEPVWFPAPPASGASGVTVPMLEPRDGGVDLFRFSYNLLTAGGYDPTIDAPVANSDLPLGSRGLALAERVNELFLQERVRILLAQGQLLVWENQRLLHARSEYVDRGRHLTRFWIRGGLS